MADTKKKNGTIYENPQETIKQHNKPGLQEPKRDIFYW